MDKQELGQGQSDRRRWTGTFVLGQNDRDGNMDMNKGTRIKGHEQGQSNTNRDRDRGLEKRETERSRRTGTVTDGQGWGMRDRWKTSE